MNDEEAFCECFIHVCVIPMMHCWKCLIDNVSHCCFPLYFSITHPNDTHEVGNHEHYHPMQEPILSPPEIHGMDLPQDVMIKCDMPHAELQKDDKEPINTE